MQLQINLPWNLREMLQESATGPLAVFLFISQQPFLLCDLTRCLVPPDENQPHSMVLPPQYFTVDMVFLFFWVVGSVRSVAHHFEF